MKPGRTAARLALLTLALAAMAADWRNPAPGEGPQTAPVRRIDDQRYVAVNDLARMIDATKFWRADVRRLVLRTGPHTIVLTADNPFAVVDERTLWLGAPVRSHEGELHVPVSLIDSLPSDSTLARLTHDVRRDRVVVLPRSGGVSSPRLTIDGDVTRLAFPADRADEAVVVTRARARFRLRFGGVFVGALPDSLPAASLLRAIRPIAAAGGSAFECAIATEAAGYRLVQEPGRRRVILEIAREPRAGFEPFAPEGPEGERRLQVVVLDPGHGGLDHGVTAGNAVEKDLSLQLAQLLEAELESQGVRVALTRNDDREIPIEARAELANRLNADLVVSIHFDGYVHPHARGATAYCPPASVVGPERLALTSRDAGESPAVAVQEGASRVALVPWREVATWHAVQSRALAEAVLSALELRGQGPTRLRERLPYELLGVNAPGILLECATLTAPDDRERVEQEEGMRQLVASIAEGIAAYRRNR